MFDGMIAPEPTDRPSFAEVLERLELFISGKDDTWLDGRVWETGPFYHLRIPMPAEPAEPAPKKSLKTVISSIF